MFNWKDFLTKMDVSIVFGVPGCGKTTLVAMLAKKCQKYGIKCYANVDLYGIPYVRITSADVGKYALTDGVVILDEASVDFNNRDFKNLGKHIILYAKYHRHYRTKVILLSQSYDDMDITFRRLSDRYYIMRRWLLGCSIMTPIRRKVGIDETTHQIQDLYDFSPLAILTSGYILRRFYYRYFDSYSTPVDLPVHPNEVQANECKKSD